MKKFLLTVAVWATIQLSAFAQFSYNFSTYYDSYDELTTGTVLSDTVAWNDTASFVVNIPFAFEMGGVPVTSLSINGGNMALSDAKNGKQQGIMVLPTKLLDRGISDAHQKSKSPISYAVTGTMGNRILKIEVKNAGLKPEWDNWKGQYDSVSFQLWLYEVDTSFEVRYGKSRLSYFSSYFPLGLLTGYIRDVDTGLGSTGTFYFLSGSQDSPTVDSVLNPATTLGLTNYPTEGRVYRYEPKAPVTTGINSHAVLSKVKVYPTQCSDEVTVDNPHNDVLNYSVVDMRGSVQQIGTLQSGSNRVDVSGLAAGMYLLKIDDGVYGAVKRIVKL